MKAIFREALEDKKNDFIYEVVGVQHSSHLLLLADHDGNVFNAPIENYVMLKEDNDYCV